jgi:hypothetical protein
MYQSKLLAPLFSHRPHIIPEIAMEVKHTYKTKTLVYKNNGHKNLFFASPF